MMQPDTITTSSDFAANRARGQVAFDVALIDGRTRRRDVHESGSLRVRFPSPENEGLFAIFVNTAGGVAGGDQFSTEIALGEASRLMATTAAAEKVYRSHGPAALIDISLTVKAGAQLAWMPQETIVFDSAKMVRRIDIDLADTASLALCEIVVLGRAAMGETMRSGSLVDRWRLRIGGKLVFAETLRLDADIAASLNRRAVANGGLAIGTALIVPGDEALVTRMRAAASDFGGEVGISSWNGFALARFCAQNAADLRADMVAVLTAAGATLPRLWSS